MTRKTLLMMAVLAALGAGAAVAATPPDTAGKRTERLVLDKNGDGFIDRAEAAAHPRLAGKFDELDKNKDGKLSADERPQRAGKWGRKGHGPQAGLHGRGFGHGKLDADRDGRISRAEAAADARFAARFDQADANKDGFVDRADREAHAKQRRDQWFAAADADRDGKLTHAEIDAADGKRRAEFQQRMQARADERFAGVDADKDGRISREEARAHPRLGERFDQLDANKDGFLGKDELRFRHARR